MREQAPSINRDQADRNQDGGQAEAERHDQEKSERHPVKRDGAQQNHQRGRAGYDPAGHAQRHELLIRKVAMRGMRVPVFVLVLMMLVRMGVGSPGMMNMVVGVRECVTFVMTPRAMVVMIPRCMPVAGIALSKHVEAEQCDGRA